VLHRRSTWNMKEKHTHILGRSSHTSAQWTSCTAATAKGRERGDRINRARVEQRKWAVKRRTLITVQAFPNWSQTNIKTQVMRGGTATTKVRCTTIVEKETKQSQKKTKKRGLRIQRKGKMRYHNFVHPWSKTEIFLKRSAVRAMHHKCVKGTRMNAAVIINKTTRIMS
jgi:hypothetical protein